MNSWRLSHMWLPGIIWHQIPWIDLARNRPTSKKGNWSAWKPNLFRAWWSQLWSKNDAYTKEQVWRLWKSNLTEGVNAMLKGWRKTMEKHGPYMYSRNMKYISMPTKKEQITWQNDTKRIHVFTKAKICRNKLNVIRHKHKVGPNKIVA